MMRIIRQPDVLNEAYSFRYQSRPWPLCHVPQTTEVRGTVRHASRHQSYVHWVTGLKPGSLVHNTLNMSVSRGHVEAASNRGSHAEAQWVRSARQCMRL